MTLESSSIYFPPRSSTSLLEHDFEHNFEHDFEHNFEHNFEHDLEHDLERLRYDDRARNSAVDTKSSVEFAGSLAGPFDVNSRHPLSTSTLDINSDVNSRRQLSTSDFEVTG